MDELKNFDMQGLENKVIAMYTQMYYTHEIAKTLGLTEAEVVYILEKNHYC